MDYCGIEVGPGLHHLCALREVRLDRPPVRLEARFFEAGPVEAVAARIRTLGDVVVAIAAPVSRPREGREQRVCDQLLTDAGVAPRAFSEDARRLAQELADLGVFAPRGDGRQGPVPEGSFKTERVFETSAEGSYSALQRRRLPARRHPLGIQRRMEELLNNYVIDAGGDLLHRRIDEIEAAGAALCAHRYAVGHARWIGDPDEGVLVLPGSGPLEPFTTDGVLPPVTRVPL